MPVKDPKKIYSHLLDPLMGGRAKEKSHRSPADLAAALDENPKHIQAMKDGKAPLEYLVDFVMTGDAYVHQGGAIKYGYRNWTIDKIKASTYIAAIRRHLKAWSEGEDLDPDSGWSHLYHIRAGCAIVLDADNSGTLIDDRDRAESISQEKEEELSPRNQFVVRYTTAPTIAFDAIRTPARTVCFGPFKDFTTAKYFLMENLSKQVGVGSIDTVSPI